MKSMTAYASAQKTASGQSVQIAMRSLNFKYLDISIRNLPIEDILLEEEIKRQIKKKINRGKVEVFVFLSKGQGKKIQINEDVVAKYISRAKSLAKKYKLDSSLKITDIFNLPQVTSCQQRTKDSQGIISLTLKEALTKLIEFKKKEGIVIKKEMLKNLSKLNRNALRIKKEKPKARDTENGKEDIDEELSLMAFYIGKLAMKINSNKHQLKGKSIDFLTQEILRELNAASSKTKKKIPALLIVEAKNYLERIREQTQNIE